MEWFINNLGTLIAVLSVLVTSAITVSTIKNDVKHLDGKITKLEKDTNDLKEVVIGLAKQEGRIHALEQVVLLQGNRLDATSIRIDKIILSEHLDREE